MSLAADAANEEKQTSEAHRHGQTDKQPDIQTHTKTDTRDDVRIDRRKEIHMSELIQSD